jgi:hypothetical protein
MTNKELQEKIISLETRINNLETRDSLGERISLLLPLLEDHAKTCPDFNGFKISHTQDSEDPENLFYQASVTFQCSCNRMWIAILSDELNIPVLQQYLEMINKKYKIDKPKINNIADRIELNEPTN